VPRLRGDRRQNKKNRPEENQPFLLPFFTPVTHLGQAGACKEREEREKSDEVAHHCSVGFRCGEVWRKDDLCVGPSTKTSGSLKV
jgi:hypothetical protein